MFYQLDDPNVFDQVRKRIAGCIIPGPGQNTDQLATAILTDYIARTKLHINLVMEVAKILASEVAADNIDPDDFLSRVTIHDRDKLDDPETAAVYAVACDYQYNKAHQGTYEIVPKILDKFEFVAWPKHISRNAHHIDKRYGNKDAKGCYVVNDGNYGTAVPEMICDWASIYLEKGEKSAKWWYDSQNGKKFLYTGKLAAQIERYLDILDHSPNQLNDIRLRYRLPNPEVKAEEALNAKLKEGMGKEKIVYHGSTQKLAKLEVAKMGKWYRDKKGVFVTPYAAIAVCFVCDRSDIRKELRDLGVSDREINFRYDQWDRPINELKNASLPKKIVVTVDGIDKSFKSFTKQYTGYLYSIDFKEYEKDSDMFSRNPNSDVEFLIHRDITPMKVEKFTVSCTVKPGKAGSLESLDVVSSEQMVPYKGRDWHLSDIKNLDDLKAFYRDCRYGLVVNGRPWAETHRVTTELDYYQQWRLLSPQQLVEIRCGVCYDTAYLSNLLLQQWRIRHECYFSCVWDQDNPGDTDGPTHTFVIYEDVDHMWKWLEGSWGPFKKNQFKATSTQELLSWIGKALANDAKIPVYLRRVASWPQVGCTMRKFTDHMMQNRVIMKIDNDASTEQMVPYSREDVTSVIDGVIFDGKVKTISFPSDEIDKLKTQDKIITTRVSADYSKYYVGDLVKTPWDAVYEVTKRQELTDVNDHPYFSELTKAQVEFLSKYSKLAVLTLKKTDSAAEALDPKWASKAAIQRNVTKADLEHFHSLCGEYLYHGSPLKLTRLQPQTRHDCADPVLCVSPFPYIASMFCGDSTHLGRDEYHNRALRINSWFDHMDSYEGLNQICTKVEVGHNMKDRPEINETRTGYLYLIKTNRIIGQVLPYNRWSRSFEGWYFGTPVIPDKVIKVTQTVHSYYDPRIAKEKGDAVRKTTNLDEASNAIYRIYGAILGCLGNHAKDVKYEVVEQLDGDPWQAIIRSANLLTYAEVVKWHQYHVVDVDRKGVPYYFIVKDTKSHKEYVWYSDDAKWMPINTPTEINQAKQAGRRKGLVEEQLDFDSTDTSDQELASKEALLPFVATAAFKEIEKRAKPHYRPVGQNSWCHIQQVYSQATRACMFVEKRALNLKEYASILFHDSSCLTDTKKDGHNLRGAEIAKRELADLFVPADLEEIVTAIQEHDSYPNKTERAKWSSITGDLLATGDFNPPDAIWILNKSYTWGIKKGLNHQQRIENAIKTVPAQYGRHGTKKMPEHYRKYFADKLESMYQYLDNLTAEIAERDIMAYRKQHKLSANDLRLPDSSVEELQSSGTETYTEFTFTPATVDEIVTSTEAANNHLPKIDVVKIDPSDDQAIAVLSEADKLAMEATRDTGKPLTKDEIKQLLKDGDEDHSTYAGVLFKHEQQVIGSAVYVQQTKDTMSTLIDGKSAWDICNFAIMAKYQGKGLGYASLIALLQYLRKLKKQPIALGVGAHNSRAIALYKKVGFKEVARRKEKDGRVGIVMVIDGTVGSSESLFGPDITRYKNNRYLIKNFPLRAFCHRTQRLYSTSKLSHLLQAIGIHIFGSRQAVSIHRFFVPELVYILGTTHFSNQLISNIVQNTWMGKLPANRTLVDAKRIDQEMDCTLMPHQLDFINVYGLNKDRSRLRGYLLSFEQGLGKTITSLALMCALNKERVFILCPKNTMLETWKAHLERFFRKPQSVYVTGVDKVYNGQKWCIFNYDALEKMSELIAQTGDGNIGMIVDESHNFLRAQADRTKRLVALAKHGPLANADILMMSGTPIKCTGIEMIPMMQVLDPLFDDEAVLIFKQAFGLNTAIATDVLHARLNRIMTRVTKDVLKLPEKREQVIKVKMPTGDKYTAKSVQRALTEFTIERKAYHQKLMPVYQQEWSHCIAYLNRYFRDDPDYQWWLARVNELIRAGGQYDWADPSISKMNAMEKTLIEPALPKELLVEFRHCKAAIKYLHLKIRGEVLGQCLGRLRMQMTTELMQASPIVDLVNEAEKKTLVFTSFVDTIELAEKFFQEKGFKTIAIYGKTSDNLAALVKTFQTDPAYNPLIASLQTLATGATLTAANRVIFLNKPWRSIDYQQASDRVHRIGQDCAVDIISIVLDTGNEPNLSTRMEDIMAYSQQMFDGIVGGKSAPQYDPNEPEVSVAALLPDDIQAEEGLEELISSQERLYLKHRVILERLKHCPRVYSDDLKRRLVVGDVLIPYPKSRTTSKLMQLFGKLERSVYRMSFTSCKMYIGNGQIIGYGLKPGSCSIDLYPIDKFIQDYKGVIVVRHKNHDSTKLHKAADYMKQCYQNRELHDYSQSNAVIGTLKRLLHLATGEENDTQVPDPEKAVKMICSSLVAYAYRYAGLDLGMPKNVSTALIMPRDYLLSTNFEYAMCWFGTGEVNMKEQMTKGFESLSIEALDPASISKKQRHIIDYICKICDIMDPSKLNSKRYHKFLDNMTPKEFDQWMQYIRNGKWLLHVVAPNMIVNLQNANLLKAADACGCNFFHRIWMTDVNTGRKYLTDNAYPVFSLPIRRQQQFLDEKISVPDDDRHIDGMTGQVTGDSKSTQITNPEINILAFRGLEATLNEMVAVRGGNVVAYGEFRRQAEDTGEVHLNELDPTARSRTAIVAQVLLNAMHIANNIV